MSSHASLDAFGHAELRGIGLGPGGMRDPGGGSLQMALAFRRLQLRVRQGAQELRSQG